MSPIYEFRCDVCGVRFEELVPVGTSSSACPECGSDRTARVLSPPGAPLRLVRSPAANRRQEASNASLQARARERLKNARRKGGGSE